MSMPSNGGQPTAPRRLTSVANLSKRHDGLSESSVRWLIHCSKPRHGAKSLTPANGLADAIVHIGRRVLIDEDRFFEILAKMNVEASHD